MLLFLLSLLLVSFSNTIHGHIMIIPYPYYNREYAVNSTKYIGVNQSPPVSDYYSNTKKNWEFVFNGVSFYRSAHRAYDFLSNNKYLAAAFHGRSEFDLSDLSPNSEIIYIKNENEKYKNVLRDNEYIKYEGLVRPMYQLEEYGITLAADIIKKISDKTTLLCQLRLPMINKSIYHNQKWNSIKYADKLIGDDRLYVDSLNKYFKVRVDYLFEKEIIPAERSIADFKKINGAAFLSHNDDNYFLEKPYFSNNIYFNEKTVMDEIEDIDIINSYENQENFKKNKNNLSLAINDWYAMTEFDEAALPTKNSLLFYDELIASSSFIDEKTFLNEITKGKFLDKNFNWNSIKMNYIAPLDIQCNITKIFKNDNIIVQGLFAFIIPMKNNYIENNYLASSFFKDQYAFRLGSQMTYDINAYYKILFYGSWQYYFPFNQIIPAIFENISAYGLAPLYLKGKVSWYEWYLASHLVIKYTNYMGLDLGYQYIYKAGDKVIPECENFYLINGESHKLDYSSWEKFSTSIANLLGINMYYYWGSFQFDIGGRILVAGKNSIKLEEFSLRIGLDF